MLQLLMHEIQSSPPDYLFYRSIILHYAAYATAAGLFHLWMRAKQADQHAMYTLTMEGRPDYFLFAHIRITTL